MRKPVDAINLLSNNQIGESLSSLIEHNCRLDMHMGHRVALKVEGPKIFIHPYAITQFRSPNECPIGTNPPVNNEHSLHSLY